MARLRPLAGGARFEAHVPNPGRMEELLVDDVTSGYAIPAPAGVRRTAWDLVSVVHRGHLVSVDTRIGNRLTAMALAAGRLAPAPRRGWVPEFRVGDSRIDFGRPSEAEGVAPRGLVEVKCSNLRVDDAALFPDAPTARGRHHVDLLARAARRGVPATLAFIVQRSDVSRFVPNRALDPEFARALDRAVAAGVRVQAWTTFVTPGAVTWGRPLPVEGVARAGLL